MKGDVTSIRITVALRDALANIGKKRETYEDIIWRLIKEAGYNLKGEKER